MHKESEESAAVIMGDDKWKRLVGNPYAVKGFIPVKDYIAKIIKAQETSDKEKNDEYGRNKR